MRIFVDFRDYWRRVHSRGVADTIAMFPIAGDRKKLAANISIFVVSSIVLWAIVGTEGALSELPQFVSGVAAVVFVFLVFYALNFIAAPHRMDREAREQIRNLEQVKSTAQERGEIAEPLRQKLKEAQDELTGLLMSPTDFASWAYSWEQAVLNLMRNNLPEHEIHMFESVSTLQNNPSQWGMDDKPYEALSAKVGKLRLIVNRLLLPPD